MRHGIWGMGVDETNRWWREQERCSQIQKYKNGRKKNNIDGEGTLKIQNEKREKDGGSKRREARNGTKKRQSKKSRGRVYKNKQ